ncbi:hypothetical protein [Streptomyces sp. NPDC020965]|uniref:hypothetical protein n=1 Tax=Streptomyces sp. NPDC020965 TaxID=3365105 RepID=UPI0037BAC3CF
MSRLPRDEVLPYLAEGLVGRIGAASQVATLSGSAVLVARVERELAALCLRSGPGRAAPLAPGCPVGAIR